MQKLNPSKVLLKKPSVYDIPGFTSKEKRKQILHLKMIGNSKFMVKGGTSQNNPYKDLQDIIIAEKREIAEYYQKSVLWSPKYTPWHFKNLFFYPALGVCCLMLYIRYIAVPRHMKKLKAKGYNFPDLEERGWLDGWLDEDEDDDYLYNEVEKPIYEYQNQVNQAQTQQFSDWTMKDLYNLDKKDKQKLETQAQQMREQNKEKKRGKMQDKLTEFYNYKEQQSEQKAV